MAGCVHIYCGDGKGKTSAAIGLAVRAAGYGRRIRITRFLKTEQSGETGVLREIPGITVTPCSRSFGFFFQMSEEQKKAAKLYYTSMLDDTLACVENGGTDMLILDEIMAVCSYELVEEETLVSFLKRRPEQLEVVLTGRNPSERLLELADYITEMKKTRHPYDKGMAAREGIEY